jgi:hypothetical protein
MDYLVPNPRFFTEGPVAIITDIRDPYLAGDDDAPEPGTYGALVRNKHLNWLNRP